MRCQVLQDARAGRSVRREEPDRRETGPPMVRRNPLDPQPAASRLASSGLTPRTVPIVVRGSFITRSVTSERRSRFSHSGSIGSGSPLNSPTPSPTSSRALRQPRKSIRPPTLSRGPDAAARNPACTAARMSGASRPECRQSISTSSRRDDPASTVGPGSRSWQHHTSRLHCRTAATTARPSS